MAGRVGTVTISLVACVLLLSACSDDGGDGGDDAASTTTTAPSTTSTTEESTTSTTEEPEVEGLEVVGLAAGDQHACAVGVDGVTRCWGYNRHGQLGDGSTDDSTEPVAIGGEVELTDLAAGRYFTCGLDADGAAWCWGDNSSGQIGDGTNGAGGDSENRSVPTPVLGAVSFTQLAAGQNHVCGVDGDGALWCWGSYPSGQLGVDLAGDATEPVRGADGIVVDLVAAAGANTCVLDTDGAAWCVGNNTFGQLGNGVTDNRAQPTPVAVGGGRTFVDLAVGDRHACGLDVDGVVWCWGDNGSGQLGDGSTESRLEPTAVDSDAEFTAVVAGNAHTCALDVDGAAWCWGENTDGRLGDADEDAEAPDGDDATSPVPVTTDLAWDAMSLGEEYSCGISSDGIAHCWGSNRAGWLGNGTQDPALVPTPVLAAG